MTCSTCLSACVTRCTAVILLELVQVPPTGLQGGGDGVMNAATEFGSLECIDAGGTFGLNWTFLSCT